MLAAAFPPGAITTAVGPPRRAVVQALADGKDEEVIQSAADGFESLAGSGRIAACVVEGAHEEAAWAAARGGSHAHPPPLPPNLPSVRLALNARLAAAMGVRVLVVVDADSAAPHERPGASHAEDAAFGVATRAAVCVRALRRAGADVLGVLVNKGGGTAGDEASHLASALRPRLAAAGTRLVGVLPTDGGLASPGLAELATGALGARSVRKEAGGHALPDVPVSGVVLAAGSVEGTRAALKKIRKRGGGGSAAAPPPLPLVLADADRGDLVDALAGAGSPALAALVLCGAGFRARPPGVVAAAAAVNPPFPILATPLSVGDALLATSRVTPSIRPASKTKIAAAVALWRGAIPDDVLLSGGGDEGGGSATLSHADPPARFLSRIFASAAGPVGGAAPLARIILPESGDARVLAAAVEVRKEREREVSHPLPATTRSHHSLSFILRSPSAASRRPSC